MTVDLKLLVVLDALISEQHVGRAAQRIGLSQPATSHALARIRHLLNDPILVRTGRSMMLTPRAEALREQLAGFIAATHRVLDEPAFDPATSTRRFTLMLPDLVCHLIVPSLLRAIAEQAPGVVLNIIPWRGPELLSDWTLRSIDFIITSMPWQFPGFLREPLYRDKDVLVVRSAHPRRELLRHKSCLDELSHIAVVSAGEVADEIDVWLASLGMRRRIAAVAPNYTIALEICATTDLVGFLPCKFAATFINRRGIEIHAAPVEPDEDVLDLLIRDRIRQDAATQWLRSLIVAIAADL